MLIKWRFSYYLGYPIYMKNIQPLCTIEPGSPGCNCEIPVNAPGEIRIAPLPPQIIPQGIVTPGLLAHVVTAKYVDAIPLYRQEQQFITLSRVLRYSSCNFSFRPGSRFSRAEGKFGF